MRRCIRADFLRRAPPDGRHRPFARAAGAALLLVLAYPPGLCSGDPGTGRLEAPLLSDEDAAAYLFTIPAPRGLIVDRRGVPLARSRSVERAALRLDRWHGRSAGESIRAALATIRGFPFPGAVSFVPSEATLQFHWEHRRSLPFVFTGALSPVQAERIRQASLFEPALCLQTEYQREYPQGHSASHLVGYVARGVLHPAGPVRPEEPLWPEVRGVAGLEKAFDRGLRGSSGLVNQLDDNYGLVRKEHLIRAPVPGTTLVLSLDLRLQRLAEQILQASGRCGAMVVMEAHSGEVLVLASHPTFDAEKFVPAIRPCDLETMRAAPGNPFFARAFAGLYPPGSILKPMVALAAMKDGRVKDARFRYHCGPSLDVAGRLFHNWSTRAAGPLTVSEALCRSNNVWFYQAAIDTGGQALIRAARGFGLGAAPELPLEGAAAGCVPDALQGKRAIANFAIGQGELLVSPLQMTAAYCALANGGSLPRPRLLLQIQAPPPDQSVLEVPGSPPSAPLPYAEAQIRAVRQGLWDSVNSAGGTGRAARLDGLKVLGKTGTAQWTPENGQERWVAWFAGFLESGSPQLVFTAMCESLPGEPISGGQAAAPLMAEFLRTVYANPGLFRLAGIGGPTPALP